MSLSITITNIMETYSNAERGRGVLEELMTGGLTELHIANPKKYRRLKVYTQKIPTSKYPAQKIQDLIPQY